MNKKKSTPKDKAGADASYSVRDKAAVLSFWDGATAHKGIAELRAKRGRPKKAER
jgi:hypothetical protein